jgi:uncharacterized protein
VKVAVTIEYLPDKGRLQDAFQQHRGYLRTFLENGTLRAAGPFADDSGALWVLDVETIEEAEQIVRGDPAVAAGVFVSWKIRPLSYWSAQESKGKCTLCRSSDERHATNPLGAKTIPLVSFSRNSG